MDLKKKIKLTAAIATYNEERNIGDCLNSIQNIVDEIVIVDGSSKDKTVDICKEFGARILVTQNRPNFHINKQKAFNLSKGEWILYLDADERVSKDLAKEIKKIINMSKDKIEDYQNNISNSDIFNKHLKLLEKRDGKIGDGKGEYVAFFVPRLNYFLGRYLKYGGVYPDGVIRLFKNKKAFLPCKDVHEQMTVLGKVGWLQNNLLHIDSPSFSRYLERNNRYVTFLAELLRKERVEKNIFQAVNYIFIKPLWWFFLTQVRHKGILDGIPGIIFSFFSALRFPRAYLIYLSTKND